MLRFAPSPMGDMDIKDLRIAIINYIVASQKNDRFIIRIEDTKKDIEGKDTEIMQILEKFALSHDTVSHQSERLGIHQTLAIKLLEENKAYICVCNSEECSAKCENLTKDDYTRVKKSGEKFVIRIKAIDEMDSFIILDRNSTPSYNFSCACEDMLSGVDFIIVNESQISNTQKQKYIKSSLGYETDTTYIHISKLDGGDISIKSLFKEGFVPDAILNYLILLSNTSTPKEIFTLPESIEWFNLSLVSSAKFDIEKLKFINREHLKLIDDKSLSTLFGFADSDIGKLAKVYLQTLSTTKELEIKIANIFGDKDFNNKFGEDMKVLQKIIKNAPYIKEFEEFEKYLSKESGLDGECLYTPLRLILTNSSDEVDLSSIYPLIKSYLLEII